jgi:hypothetical protein
MNTDILNEIMSYAIDTDLVYSYSGPDEQQRLLEEEIYGNSLPRQHMINKYIPLDEYIFTYTNLCYVYIHYMIHMYHII